MSASGGVMRLPRRGQPALWTILEIVLVLLLAVAAVVVLANLGGESAETQRGSDEGIVITQPTWEDRIAAMEEIAPRRRAP